MGSHGRGRLAGPVERKRDGADVALAGLRALDGILPGAVRDRARSGERGERYQRTGSQSDGHRLSHTGRPEEPGGGDATDPEVPAEAATLGAATRRAQRRGDVPHGRLRGLRAVQGRSSKLCAYIV